MKEAGGPADGGADAFDASDAELVDLTVDGSVPPGPSGPTKTRRETSTLVAALQVVARMLLPMPVTRYRTPRPPTPPQGMSSALAVAKK